jgi:hypothetical protein
MSVVAAAFLAGPTPAAAGPDKEIVTVDEGSIPGLEVMRAQQPLVDAAQAITALDPKRDGLGGLRLQAEKNTVELYWKGEVPDRVREEIAVRRSSTAVCKEPDTPTCPTGGRSVSARSVHCGGLSGPPRRSARPASRPDHGCPRRGRGRR